MKKYQRGFTLVEMGVVLWGVFLLGWIFNIVQVFQQMPAVFSDATPMWIAKIVCIFIAPVGAVLGWIGLF